MVRAMLFLLLLTRRSALARPNQQLFNATILMPKVEQEMHKAGDFLVDYEEKVFPDVKADPGEKALVTFHTVAFEGSIGIVNTLVASRLLRILMHKKAGATIIDTWTV